MKNELSRTPLQTWGAESLYREALRAARRWRNEPAFNSGGPLDDIGDRAQEVVCCVLEHIKRRGISGDESRMDQVTLFHRIAEYYRFEMVQQCYSVKTTEIFDDEADDDDNARAELGNIDADAERDQERQGRIQEIFEKIGITEADWAVFGDANGDLAEAFGICEREVRNIKAGCRESIIKKLEKFGLLDEIKLILGIRQLGKLKPI